MTDSRRFNICGNCVHWWCNDQQELTGFCRCDLESAEDILLRENHIDAARDVRRLIEYIKSARNCVGVLHAQLAPVLKAVEWCQSCDISDDDLARTIEAYRRRNEEARRD